ncbi:RICIN domain-containing protein [Streptococcus ferus]|uniref:RICIN domain-containing protein n=1 Tax=Streptococcus ferus TaxID=1345 RepID=UPI00359F3388
MFTSRKKVLRHKIKKEESLSKKALAGITTIVIGTAALSTGATVYADNQTAPLEPVLTEIKTESTDLTTTDTTIAENVYPEANNSLENENGALESSSHTEQAAQISEESSLINKDVSSTVESLADTNETETRFSQQEEGTERIVTNKSSDESVVSSQINNIVTTPPITTAVTRAYYSRDYRNGGCVNWAKDRANELLGLSLPSTGEWPTGVAGAANWWYILPYPKGNEPAKYALAIWRYTSVSPYENYGHVAFVEDVKGDIVTISQGGFVGASWNNYLGVSYRDYSKSQVPNIERSFLGYVYLKGTPTPTPVPVKRYDVEQLSKSVGQTISDGDYHIVLASNPDYGVDVAGAASKNGTNIQIYQNTKTAAQVFTVSYLGGGYYKLIHKFTNKSMDVASASRDIHTNVQLWDYNGSEAQQWILKQNGLNNTFEIISRRSGLSLDVAGGVVTNGRNIQMYEANGSNAQKFRFIAVDDDAKQTIADGVYRIVSAINETMGLDIAGGGTANNTNVQIYPNLSDSNQTFEIKYLNNGYYSITSKKSGKALDAVGNGSYNGTNVVIYSSNNSDAQQWIIKESNMTGFFEIISKQKNMLLDVAEGIAKPGNNVQLYVRNGSLAQKWKFIPV